MEKDGSKVEKVQRKKRERAEFDINLDRKWIKCTKLRKEKRVA